MRALTSRTAALAGIFLVATAAGASTAGAQRTFTGNRFVLEIPSLGSGLAIKTIEGGHLVADLAPEPSEKGAMGKRVTGTRVAPFVLTANPVHVAPLLKAALDGVPLDGRLVVADFDYSAKDVIDFRQAVATRIALATLDGASRDACSVEITLAPGTVAASKGDNADIRGKILPKMKSCLRSNFAVRLGDLPTKRVASIDSIVLSRPMAAGAAGPMRPQAMAARTSGREGGGGGIEASNVTLSISYADVAEFQKWNEDFLAKGSNASANELTLEVAFLAPDMREEYLILRGSGVGLVAMRRSFEANSEKVARFHVELYVERWELVPGTITLSNAQ